jgi:nucleoside-diphosphate-sugar epimerase
MLVALTGPSGFIGSYTAAALHRRGHRVRGLVRDTSRTDHISDVVSELIVGSHDDPAAIEELVRGVDAVIHNFLDWSHPEADIGRNFQSNVLGSLRLLEMTRLAGVKQFIFVSSCAVYHEIPERAAGRITEETVSWPLGDYGAYKVAVEAHLKAYHHTYKMNTSAWRPAAVYGIDPKLRRSQWYELIDAARRGQTIDTPRGGKITHVDDVADALSLSVGDESVAGQFFNLVERYMYWQEAAEIARELSGAAATIVDRQGAGPKNQFDPAKAIAFFERHENHVALRRGMEGVRAYVGELIVRIRE